jgi:hypothetical protein
MPGTSATPGSLGYRVAVYVNGDELFEPSAACLPLPPDDAAKMVVYPCIQISETFSSVCHAKTYDISPYHVVEFKDGAFDFHASPPA